MTTNWIRRYSAPSAWATGRARAGPTSPTGRRNSPQFRSRRKNRCTSLSSRRARPSAADGANGRWRGRRSWGP